METKKKKFPKPSYLREIQIRFKKRRVKSDVPLGQPVTDSRTVYEIFKDLENEGKEKLISISVDAKLKIICYEVVAIGSTDSIKAKPVEAIRGSIPWSPYGYIIVHNHISGDPKPSLDDKKFTKQLNKICQIHGFYFLDHIIIGHDTYFSFSDKGLLK